MDDAARQAAADKAKRIAEELAIKFPDPLWRDKFIKLLTEQPIPASDYSKQLRREKLN